MGGAGTGYGNHRAGPSVEAFLRNITWAIDAPIRVGGIQFNEGDPDSIDMSKLRSLSAFTTMDAFITDWLYNGYSPDGGDRQELQLDALGYAAADLSAHSTTTARYVLLLTDADYHENEGGSQITKLQVISDLAGAGCCVYVSPWEEYMTLTGVYEDLLVGSG